MKIRVAGIKIAVTKDIEQNTQKICTAIEKAADEKSDILLTPEGSLSGYTHEFDQSAVGTALNRVTSLARMKGVGLALGTCFTKEDGNRYNQIRFYRPDGEYLGFHSKILTCGTWDDPPEGEINHFVSTPLRVFQWNSELTIGGLICNDLWANPGCTPIPDPHLTQQFALMGGRVLFHAVNGGRGGDEWSEVAWNFHESNLLMRARAGKIWIASVDSSFPTDMPSSAPSGVINPNGEWACRSAAKGERFFVHTITLDI